jgi:hypothetical protein
MVMAALVQVSKSFSVSSVGKGRSGKGFYSEIESPEFTQRLAESRIKRLRAR